MFETMKIKKETNMFDIMESEIDDSVNFVCRLEEGQALEARYVRRHPDYIACYLSSQTACSKACRMCHLTFTGQTHDRDTTLEEILWQTKQVLEYYANQPKAKIIHFNFMARGEPLSSETLILDSQELLLRLGQRARDYGLLPRFLISTIMPKGLPGTLDDLFPVVHPEIYYSLYSMREDFRRRWLPKAMEPRQALDLLKRWQDRTKKIIRIHHALIEGENDSVEEVRLIHRALSLVGLRADFTLVRYNPPSEEHSQESPRYKEYAEELQFFFPEAKIKVIDRVGEDVAASCGMFV